MANAVTADAQPVELADGHVDLIEVTLDGSRIRIQVKDDTRPGGAVFRDPSTVVLRVPERARTEVPPGTQFAFLGSPGAPVYLLPQVQAAGLVWPGWSTERLAPGQVAGDRVSVALSSLSGPGKLALFTTSQFGAPTVLFDSGRVAASNRMDVAARVHAHGGWAFERAGEYRVGITVSATLPDGTPISGTASYLIVVGEPGTNPTSPGSVTVPRPSAPSSAPTAGAPSSPNDPAGTPSGSGSRGSQSGSGSGSGDGASVLAESQESGARPGLARTGVGVVGPVIAAGLAISAGGLLVIMTRRRRG